MIACFRNINLAHQLEVFSDRAILCLLALCGIVIPVTAKGIVFIVLLLALFATLNLWLKGEKIALPLNGVVKSLLIFLIFAGVSFLWAEDSMWAVGEFGKIATILICSVPLFSYAVSRNALQVRQFRRVFFMSFVVAWVVIALVVFMPDHFIQIVEGLNSFLADKGIGQIQVDYYFVVSDRALVILVPLSFIAFAFCIKKTFWRILVICAFSVVILNSDSQTALFAFFVPLVFIVLTIKTPLWRWHIFAASLLIAMVSILPLSIINHQEQWMVNLLPPKFVQEAHIEPHGWVYYAYSKAILDAPVIGQGLHSATLVTFSGKQPNGKLRPPVSHPHNIFLQIFFELGFVGGFLIFVFLLSFSYLASRVGRLSHSLSWDTSGLPVFASTFSVVYLGYSVWHSWLLGSFLFAFFVFTCLSQFDSESA